MRILVTNDDGVHSYGLWRLAEGLRHVGDVSVVAPDRDQSGIGTAMTLMDVIRAREIASPVDGVKAISVQGTPTDCVILATESLFDERFDLVVSGINQGANLGLDIVSSGTVGAAIQGYTRGISSIAISVTSLTDLHYEAASRTASVLAGALAESPPAEPLLINVNLPNVDPDQLRHVEVTRLGPRAHLEGVASGNDGRRAHYWITHERPVNADAAAGTDIGAVRDGAISISSVDLGALNGAPAELLESLAAEVRLAFGI